MELKEIEVNFLLEKSNFYSFYIFKSISKIAFLFRTKRNKRYNCKRFGLIKKETIQICITNFDRIPIFVFYKEIESLEKNPPFILLYFPSDVYSGSGNNTISFF